MSRHHTHRDVFPRRTLLRGAVIAGLAGALTPGLAACTTAASRDSIVVAGGESGGFYLEFANLLADALQQHRVAEQAKVLATGGSLDNLARLVRGEATMAVALADAAALEAGASGTYPGQIAALGRVYENYVHALVRKDSPITSIHALAGRRIAAGMPGSGTSLITPRILEVAGLESTSESAPADSSAVTVQSLGLNAGLAALSEGTVDALFWSGGVPTAAISREHSATEFRLLDLAELLPGLREKYGIIYDKVLIPGDSYSGIDAAWTIGVPNLLLCDVDLDATTVSQTVNLLVGHADELIPQSSVGVQFLSPDTLIHTGDIPLHPAAITAYRKLHG